MYKVIVFDLDQTLWWCDSTWIDMSAGAPFHRVDRDTLCDKAGERLGLFSDVRKILTELYQRKYQLVIASRSSAGGWAHEALAKLEILDFFIEVLVYTGSKVAHFEIIKKRTGIDYSDMLFFDDEERNICDITGIWVDCVQVMGGIEYSQIGNLL